MNLRNWGARVANWKKTGNTSRPIEYHIAHLHEEVSEVFGAWRDITGNIKLMDAIGRAQTNPFGYVWYTGKNEDKPEGFAIELADVVLVALFIADVTGIDLEAAMEEKMAYNETKRAKS